jgi:glycosyltransferase involved in cell wall biosynthesis
LTSGVNLVDQKELMEISYSTPRVNLTTSNGYGHAGFKIADSLTKMGHRLTYQNPKAKIQINFSQPNLYKLHRYQYQIGYTPWESTIIPRSWQTNINACDEMWTTSDWCKDVYEKNGFNISNVFPHGIDPIWSPKKREKKNVIKFLHIGEPAPRKGGQETVDAFIKLFGNNPNYSLTLKVYKSSITRVYNKTGNIIGVPYQLYNNITLDDRVLDDQDLVNLFHEHDILVYPTYGEGFGFIPLQALATGMPTISTYDWAHYKNYLGPLKLKSTVVKSPWDLMHPGNVYKPNPEHLLEMMQEAVDNFKAYSLYYYTQSTKIHEDYNWDQLTNNAFENVFKKIS